MRQVFISYSSKEAKQANEIVDVLEKQGVRCWIAPRDIPIGSDYIDQIPEWIEKCPYFLVLLSPLSQSSQWVRSEFSQAKNERKSIFPLLLEDFTINKGFQFLLINTQIRPYYEAKEQTMQEILRIIRLQIPLPDPAESCQEHTDSEDPTGQPVNQTMPTESGDSKDADLPRDALDGLKLYGHAGQEAPIPLGPGNYWGGTHIRPGRYDLLAVAGEGEFSVFNKTVAEWIWIVSNPIGYASETRPAVFRNLPLMSDDMLQINGDVKIILYPAAPISKDLSGSLGPGVYRVGKDIPSGRYDLQLVDGEGDVTVVDVKKDQYMFFQEMSDRCAAKPSEFRNLVLNRHHELWVNGNLKIKLVPA